MRASTLPADHTGEQPSKVAPPLPAPADDTRGDPWEEDGDPFAIPPLDLGLTRSPAQESETPANPWTAVDQRLGDVSTGSDLGDVAADFRLLEDVITSICLQASAMAVAQYGEQATDPANAASRLCWHSRRNDAGSINRHLDDAFRLGRAHSVGHARQHTNFLGFALSVNSRWSSTSHWRGSSEIRRRRPVLVRRDQKLTVSPLEIVHRLARARRSRSVTDTPWTVQSAQ